MLAVGDGHMAENQNAAISGPMEAIGNTWQFARTS
jgi:hypothetical protein